MPTGQATVPYVKTYHLLCSTAFAKLFYYSVTNLLSFCNTFINTLRISCNVFLTYSSVSVPPFITVSTFSLLSTQLEEHLLFFPFLLSPLSPVSLYCPAWLGIWALPGFGVWSAYHYQRKLTLPLLATIKSK